MGVGLIAGGSLLAVACGALNGSWVVPTKANAPKVLPSPIKEQKRWNSTCTRPVPVMDTCVVPEHGPGTTSHLLHGLHTRVLHTDKAAQTRGARCL